ncbi:TPA: Mor transcription activator family protein [Raoultella ornithinolytica]
MGGSIYMTLKRCELYEEINDVLHDFGIKKGMAKEDVIEFSDAVIKLLSEVFGGRNFTFPKNVQFDIKNRDVAIYKELLGSKNVAALSEKYGLTERAIRKCANKGKGYLKNKTIVDDAIYKEYKSGKGTEKEIALNHGVSVCYVINVIREKNLIENEILRGLRED